MTNKLQEQLFTKYPEIFQDRNKSMRETAMCWGIECDDGWYALIDKLCHDLIQSGNEIPIATQVKEKYGQLCFYVQKATEENFKLIIQAEKDSSLICEVCGKKGYSRMKMPSRWVKTVCNDHAKELGYPETSI